MLDLFTVALWPEMELCLTRTTCNKLNLCSVAYTAISAVLIVHLDLVKILVARTFDTVVDPYV